MDTIESTFDRSQYRQDAGENIKLTEALFNFKTKSSVDYLFLRPSKLIHTDLKNENVKTLTSSKLKLIRSNIRYKYTIKAVSYTHLDVYKRQVISN